MRKRRATHSTALPTEFDADTVRLLGAVGYGDSDLVMSPNGPAWVTGVRDLIVTSQARRRRHTAPQCEDSSVLSQSLSIASESVSVSGCTSATALSRDVQIGASQPISFAAGGQISRDDSRMLESCGFSVATASLRKPALSAGYDSYEGRGRVSPWSEISDLSDDDSPSARWPRPPETSRSAVGSRRAGFGFRQGGTTPGPPQHSKSHACDLQDDQDSFVPSFKKESSRGSLLLTEDMQLSAESELLGTERDPRDHPAGGNGDDGGHSAITTSLV